MNNLPVFPPIKDNGKKIYGGDMWDYVHINMEVDEDGNDDCDIRVDYVPFRFLGAEKITANVE